MNRKHLFRSRSGINAGLSIPILPFHTIWHQDNLLAVQSKNLLWTELWIRVWQRNFYEIRCFSHHFLFKSGNKWIKYNFQACFTIVVVASTILFSVYIRIYSTSFYEYRKWSKHKSRYLLELNHCFKIIRK